MRKKSNSHHKNTRNKFIHNLTQHKLKIFEKASQYVGCKLYQLLPEQVKNNNTKILTKFKKRLKN